MINRLHIFDVVLLISIRRIVGYTALQFPWDDRPLSSEAKAMVTSDNLPPAPEHGNADALTAFFCVGFTASCGYNPSKDYRKSFKITHGQ
jgi:hypothetical protein